MMNFMILNFFQIRLTLQYHQIRMHEDVIHKTAFALVKAIIKFMLFGLSNTLATFQATMNQLFQPFL